MHFLDNIVKYTLNTLCVCVCVCVHACVCMCVYARMHVRRGGKVGGEGQGGEKEEEGRR